MVSFLQTLGVRCSLYLDDRGMVDEFFDKISPFHAPKNAFLTCAACIAVGGFLSLDKSELDGSRKMKFLGLDLNTEKRTIRVPQDKWEKLLTRMQPLLEVEKCKVSSKTVQRIRGLAISFLLAIPMSRLYIRRMTEFIQHAWREGHHEHFPILVTDRLKDELRWWKSQKYFEIECSWLPKDLTHLEIKNVFTDSSSFAGGACILKNCGQISNVFTNYWDVGVANLPIHLKEGLIILKALNRYEHLLKGKLIHIYTDNMSVYHSSKFGCADSSLNDIILKIHQKVCDLQSDIMFSFVPTDKQLADEPSRTIDFSEEIVSPTLISQLEWILGGKFEVDLMASEENAICKKFISKCVGDNSLLVNFFTVTRLKENFLWCFPPKVIAERALDHVLRHFKDKTFCLLFHRFQEWPPVYLRTLKEKDLKIIRVSTSEKPATAIPVKKRTSDSWHPFFKRNRTPFETYVVTKNSPLLSELPRITTLDEVVKSCFKKRIYSY